eukprot:TRINITY_DN12235_c0_g1_i1.p1 TRINITY_DN12235_c0_g1~~TRINITY_DN12235_c0_g1_i1.p1  ORF type:complete len:2202 (-),score=420.18 TRINITY_DN12235_c0_g1_i1:159-6545(-)
MDTLEDLFPEGSHPIDGSFLANNVGVRCREVLTNGETRSCKVDITWLREGAGHRNVFGYYFFDTSTRTIRVDNGQQVHYPAFPDTSGLGSKGCLENGDTVTLVDDIPFDETMAFFLRENGADGTPNGKSSVNAYYSTTDYFSVGGLRNDDGYDHLNEDGEERTAEDTPSPTKHFGWVQYEDELIFGCEDLSMGRSGSDRDYNDVMFLITVTGDWDDDYVPVYDCDDFGDCEVYSCTEVTETYDGVEFEGTVEITRDGQEGIQIADFSYSWVNGGWVIDGTGFLLETHTYDTHCTTEHDGEYLFNEGECGCEETFIEANQPQLFVEAGANYWNTPGSTINNFMGTGVNVIHYERAGTTQFATDMYLRADNSEIVRVDLDDGRVLVFTDVTYSAQAVTLPAAPPGCTCRRNLDVILLLEKSGDVLGSAYSHVKEFAVKFVEDQTINSDSVNVGVVQYNANAATTLLAVKDGHVKSNVENTVNNLGCSQSDSPCANGGDGNIVAGINKAVSDHNASSRSAAQVIVVVTNGWSVTSSVLRNAVSNAASAGVTIIAVPYGSTMPVAELREITYVDNVEYPDNIVFRYQALDLSSEDSIDVSSRTCLVAGFPCSDCCGVCDSTCGAGAGGCQPVDSCEPSDSCDRVNLIVDKCCSSVAANGENCPVSTDNNGNIVEGDPNLSPCQESICDDSNGEVTCNYVDNCVESPCYTAECRYSSGQDAYTCSRTLKPGPDSSTCTQAQCSFDNNNNEIEVISVGGCDDTPTDPCYEAYCDESNGVCKTAQKSKPNRGGQCNEFVCIDDEWTTQPRCQDYTDLCAPQVCETYTAGCDRDTCWRCVDDDHPCDDSDQCKIMTCDSSDGSCSYEDVVCPSRPCQDLIGCDSSDGECKYTPRACSSPVHPCESYVCIDDACVHQPQDDVCDVCTPACTHNLCVEVPCVNQECRDDLKVEQDCSRPDDTCLATGCDPDTGCTTTQITCDHLTPTNACFEYVRDSSHPGCCKEVEKVCEGPDLCTVYGCDVNTGCTTEPKVCPTSTCQDFAPTYVNGCNPDTGGCVYVDRDCETPGCETTSCHTESDSCEIDHWDNCECNCGTNECVQFTCFRGECIDRVETQCEAKNICEVNIRCETEGVESPGCQFDLKDCSQMPPVPCKEYYRDATHPEECCQLRDIQCPTDDCSVEECNVDTNECEVVSREECPCTPACVNNRCERNTCVYNTETLMPECQRTSTTVCEAPDRCHTAAPCDPDAPAEYEDGCVYTEITCDGLDPDTCMLYEEDPNGILDPEGTECCVQVPVECPSEGCAIQGCVDDECVEVDNSPCICDPVECVNNKCVRHECNEGVCGAETLTDCSTTDTCLIEEPCDPEAEGNGCVYSPVVCGETGDPCTHFVQNSTHPGCCMEMPNVCGSASCETLKCDSDLESETVGQCIVDSRADCPCDENCLINNICVKTNCVEGECSDPILTNCTASDYCHTNARCDVSVEGGCTEDEVDCGAPPACHEWVKDPAVEECCVAVPRDCLSTGCEDLACNVDTDRCEITSTENCQCVCAPNDVCHQTLCANVLTETCADTVEKVCPESTDTCKTLRGCVVEEGGCVYDDVVCDPALLTDPCTKFIRDPTADGCCVVAPVTCPIGDDKCTEYLECDVNTNSCPTPPKVCSPATCELIDPVFESTGGCDPSDGRCVFISLECNSPDECEEKECDANGDCQVVDDALCSVCTPACPNNKCVKTACINQVCDLANQNVTDCAAQTDGDTCIEVTGCDPTEGCQFAPVNCTNIAHTACERVVRDSTAEGCCTVVPIECPADTGCATYECDDVEGCVKTNLCVLDTACQTEVCVEGACVIQAKSSHECDEPTDLCMVASCTEEGACQETPVVCASQDPCFVASCDSTDGSCVIAPIDCSDGDLCTDDVCTAGVCSNPSNCAAADFCETATCDPLVGECEIGKVTCNDGVSCTLDECNPDVGCEHQPDDDRCKSDDVCVISLGCDVNLGCLTENRTCADEDGDYCTLEFCKPFEGCSVQQIDCSTQEGANETIAELDEGCGVIFYCDSEAAECAIDPVVCVLSTAAIVTVTAIGTAAVVGIIVGIVVAVALCAGGAGVYSVYKNSDDGAENAVSVNPLYEGSSKGGANPLFHEK